MYTATKVKVLKPTGLTETYTLSLGGGEPTVEMQNLHNLFQQYIDGTGHSIAEIKRVQSFLVGSGYGLSNVILLEASPLFVAERDHES